MPTSKNGPTKIPQNGNVPRVISGAEVGDDAASVTGARSIAQRFEMVRFLAEQLALQEPHVTVNRDMVAYLMSFFWESKNMIMFDEPPFEGGQLFEMISWEEQAKSDALRCGVPLLQLMSQVSDTVARAGGVMNLESGRLIRIMVQFLPTSEKALFAYRYRNDRVTLRTTEAGVAHFGVNVNVRLGTDDGVRDEDLNELVKLR